MSKKVKTEEVDVEVTDKELPEEDSDGEDTVVIETGQPGIDGEQIVVRQRPQSDLKKLVLKGKSQGFLTYAEINDHLPENMHDTDQIEVVVNMINDMGIEVVDKAPDTDNMNLKRDNSEDQEVVEEVSAALKTAVESEFGRTTDPVRMYMREMGTVELLTREDEIALAIAQKLQVSLLGQQQRQLPVNVEVYELYLKGMHLINNGMGGFSSQ